MKRYLLGVVSGIVLAAMLMSFSAIANVANMAFNSVAIVINGNPVARWGENFRLADGTEVPYSIVYNGTTYLPMRRMAEMFGQDVFWNGDSRTISLAPPLRLQTSWILSEIVAEQADLNGNVWEYMVRDGNLIVTDHERGYRRIYRLAGSAQRANHQKVYTTDYAIYFVRHRDMQSFLYRMEFLNDENLQDGELIATLGQGMRSSQAVLYDGYVFYAMIHGMNNSFGQLIALNWRTGERTELHSTYRGGAIGGLSLTHDRNGMILEFHAQTLGHGHYHRMRVNTNDGLTFERIEL